MLEKRGIFWSLEIETEEKITYLSEERLNKLWEAFKTYEGSHVEFFRNYVI